MTRPLLESVFADERAVVHGLEGKTILYLGQDGAVYSVEMLADVLEIPRCAVGVARAACALGRPVATHRVGASLHRLVELIVRDRRLLRAVHWPTYYDVQGMIVAEEAIGVVMLDEPGRASPTPKQWAAAVAHLRILERHVAR